MPYGHCPICEETKEVGEDGLCAGCMLGLLADAQPDTEGED